MNSVFDCRLSGVETKLFFNCKLILVALDSGCFGYVFSIFNKHIRYVAIEHVNTIDERIRYITKCIKSPLPRWLRLLSWLSCCVFIVLCSSHCFWGFCVGLCFGMHYFDFSSFVIILTRMRKLVPLLLLLLFDLILYVPSTIFQLYRDGSSWVEPVLS